jgi:hypothetical protein
MSKGALLSGISCCARAKEVLFDAHTNDVDKFESTAACKDHDEVGDGFKSTSATNTETDLRHADAQTLKEHQRLQYARRCARDLFYEAPWRYKWYFRDGSRIRIESLRKTTP